MPDLLSDTFRWASDHPEHDAEFGMCIENKGTFNLRTLPKDDDQSESAKWNRILLQAENEFVILYAQYYGEGYGTATLIDMKANTFLRPFMPLDDANNILLKSFCAVADHLKWDGTANHPLFRDVNNKYGVALRLSRSLLSTRYGDAIPTRAALQTIAVHTRIYCQNSVFHMKCKGGYWSSLLNQNYQLYMITVDYPGIENEINHTCIIRQHCVEFMELNRKEARQSALMLCCPEPGSDVPQIIRAYCGKLIFFIGNTSNAIQHTTFNIRNYMRILTSLQKTEMQEKKEDGAPWTCLRSVTLPHWANSEMELTVWLRTSAMKPKSKTIQPRRRKGNMKICESSDDEETKPKGNNETGK